MLPATLVTFATFLLELCSSSPVYNMQPAFITNTVGATTGRNIRNLPCISRRNSNQSGFCMFAIDCLKANGTHLGTCIDGFYFGSCCHIEPVRDIIDNNIDTDIIPHREPPFRISSTTMKTTRITTSAPKNETTLKSISSNSSSSTTAKITTVKNITSTSTITPIIKLNASSTVSDKITTVYTTPSSTFPQKLQTFQMVASHTLEEMSTKASTDLVTNETVEITKEPVTKQPHLTLSSKRPITKEPVLSNSTLLSNTTNSKPTESISLVKVTTEKFTTASTTKPTKPAVVPEKTPKPTKVPPTKITSKPSKGPTKISTTSRPLDSSPTKSPSTTKPTKKTSSSSKPTKRVTTTAKVKISTPTVKISTTEKVTTTTLNESTSKPVVSSSSERVTNPTPTTTKRTSNKPPITTPTPYNVSTQTIETANGNVATNEIEDSNTATTIKPGLITWAVVDNKNVTTSSPTPGIYNVTTEDWVPITSPDGWVLLTSVGTNLNNVSNNSSAQESSSVTVSSVDTSTTTNSSVLSSATETPLANKPTIDTSTMNVISSSSSISSTSDKNEVPSSSGNTSEESVTLSSMQTMETIDRPVNMSDFTDVCGRRMYPEARIVGGEKSSFGKWPWQISLRQWRTSTYLHKCGAALLNENWAITAAHCVDNVPPSDLLLRLGEHDLSTESEPYLHQERRVQIVASHPQFDPRTFEYDLALLRFYEPVNFQPNILPVCVPQTDENFVGRTAYVTGWGRLYEDGPLPSILQEVSVPVINNTVCESMYRAAGYIEHIPHIFICAGWRRGGFDSCEGDSGGPMVIQRQDKRFLLAGVISWGIGCAEPNQPGVYTRISEFKDWINQILQF